MARGRMISATIAIDKRLNTLSMEGQLLFLMTVPHLDRDGLIVGDAQLLAAKAIPRRPEMHGRCEEFIQEWITSGLAIPYETDDCRVLYFPGFRKNQTFQYNREGTSQFPPPPGYRRTDTGLEPDERQSSSRQDAEQLKSNSRVSLDEITVKQNEVKQNEAPPAGGGDGFAQVCTVYEQNVGLLTKIISEKLADDIATYGAPWVTDAIGIAVTAEKRNLSYVEGILKKWKHEGRTNGNKPVKAEVASEVW